MSFLRRAATITINPSATPLSITTTSLPTAWIGAPYSFALTATGGTPPYLWSIQSGVLPPGLTLSAAGILNGTATTIGSYPLVIRATDTAGASATRGLTLHTSTLPATLPLLVSAQSISFRMPENTSSPQFQVISYAAADSSNRPISAQAQSAGWLSVSLSGNTTPGSARVTADPKGLSPGVYTGSIIFVAAGLTNSPVTIAVTLTITPAINLSASSAQVTFNIQSGGGPQSAQVSVSTGGTSVSFQAAAQPAGGWLQVSPATGSTPANLTITANPGSLTAGNYTGAVQVTSATAANSPVTIRVTLTVTPAPPNLLLSTTQLFFSQAQNSAPQSQSIHLTSSGAQLTYSPTVGANWLSTSGSGTTPGTLTVTANPAGLALGQYSAPISLDAAGAPNCPLTITVTLSVTDAGLPTLIVTPQALNLSAKRGGGAIQQEVRFTSSGAAISFSASVTGGGWLTLSAAGATTPATLLVTVNPSGLLSGAYSATIAILAQGAANNSVTMPVSLTVTEDSLPRPAISSVEHGASFAPPIAPGTWVTIRGTNLSFVERVIRSAEFVGGRRPVEASGVSVQINNRPAFLHYLSPTQLNVISPDETATGLVAVAVTLNGQTSANFTVNLERVAPAFFLWPENQAVATGADFSPRVRQGTFGQPMEAARPGEVIILWGTGFGPVSPPVPAGEIARGVSLIVGEVRVTVGGVEAEYLGGALAPSFTALYQLAIRIPASAADGDHSVVATVDGVASPAAAVISVRR